MYTRQRLDICIPTPHAMPPVACLTRRRPVGACRMGPHASACPRESSFFKGDIVYLERRSSAAHSAPAYPGDTHPGGAHLTTPQLATSLCWPN